MIDIPSPNCGPRRDGLRPELIVLHFTAMADFDAARDRLCDPEAEVSAHYLIGRDGTLARLVPEDLRAWHAGAGSWQGRGDVNSRSIGIELDNDGRTPFSAPLMAALERLMPGIMTRWGIAAPGVIAHSDMAPSRKADPGRRFDWYRLARQGLAVWPQLGAEGLGGDFHTLAVRFGYPADAPQHAVLDAFRQRFRPWTQGPVTAGDLAAVGDLAARFGVDRGAVSA